MTGAEKIAFLRDALLVVDRSVDEADAAAQASIEARDSLRRLRHQIAEALADCLALEQRENTSA